MAAAVSLASKAELGAVLHTGRHLHPQLPLYLLFAAAGALGAGLHYNTPISATALTCGDADEAAEEALLCLAYLAGAVTCGAAGGWAAGGTAGVEKIIPIIEIERNEIIYSL